MCVEFRIHHRYRYNLSTCLCFGSVTIIIVIVIVIVYRRFSPHKFEKKLPSLSRHLAMVAIVRPSCSYTSTCCTVAAAEDAKAIQESLQNHWKALEVYSVPLYP